MLANASMICIANSRLVSGVKHLGFNYICGIMASILVLSVIDREVSP